MYKKLDEHTLHTILKVSIDEFAANGPTKTTVSHIAEKAGVSVGVIYKYFKNKETLFLSCLRHSLGLLDTFLTDVITSEADIRKCLEKIAQTIISHARTHTIYNVLYNELTSRSCRAYADLLAKEIESYSARIYRELFAKGQAAGLIGSDVDSSLNAFYFDNLIMTLQFSYSCDYYRERMKIFCGDAIFDNDEAVIKSFTSFMSSALQLK